jgi:hypothetical protein
MTRADHPGRSAVLRARRRRTIALVAAILAISGVVAALFVLILRVTTRPPEVLASRSFTLADGSVVRARVLRQGESAWYELRATGPRITQDLVMNGGVPLPPVLGPLPEARVEFDEENQGVVFEVGTWGMRYDLRPTNGVIGIRPVPLPGPK